MIHQCKHFHLMAAIVLCTLPTAIPMVVRADVVPLSPYPGSDLVIYQEPGQLPWVLPYWEDNRPIPINLPPALNVENDIRIWQTPFFVKQNVNIANLSDRVLVYRNPDSPDTINGAAVPGDAVGLKVTPTGAGLGQIAVSFWSDNPVMTYTDFLQQQQLVGAPELVPARNETGFLEDINAALFPTLGSPFSQLWVGSDVADNPIIWPGGNVVWFGNSDNIFLTFPNGLTKVVPINGVVPDMALDFFDKPYAIGTPLAGLATTGIAFLEPPGEGDNANSPSDVLIMQNDVANSMLRFHFWSGDDDPGTLPGFLTSAGWPAGGQFLEFSEMGHPDVAQTLFGTIPQENWPFTKFVCESDPALDPPIPEPVTMVSALLAVAAIFPCVWRRSARHRSA